LLSLTFAGSDGKEVGCTIGAPLNSACDRTK
jgi:hypothetical protein